MGEQAAASAKHFAELDTRHDGKITYDELRLLQTPPAPRGRGGGQPRSIRRQSAAQPIALKQKPVGGGGAMPYALKQKPVGLAVAPCA